MDKVVRILSSFEESDRVDRAYYQSLTPQQRLEILCELNYHWPRSSGEETTGKVERVYRIVKFS